MTDARLPERMLTDRRFLRLTPGALRAYVWLLLWSVSNRTDGVIDDDDIPLVPGTPLDPADLHELAASGLLERADRGWVVADFATTQTSRDELAALENMRRREREKKARQRASRAPLPEHNVGTVPGDVPGEVSRGTAQDRQDRQDRQALEESNHLHVEPLTEGGGASGAKKTPAVDWPARVEAAS